MMPHVVSFAPKRARTLARPVYSRLRMLNSRSFQVVVAALIVLGMHVCCCRAMPIRFDDCGGDVPVHETSPAGCCEHGQGHDGPQDTSPAGPAEPQHDCCGVHSKPLTPGPGKAELPPVTWTLVVPVYLVVVEHAPTSFVARFGSACAAPVPETSLLRRHCALNV